MPYTLKTNQISVKDPETGEYSGVDILAEQTEQGLIAELQAEGTTQVNRINQAAVNVQAAVDQAESDAATIISNTQTSINTLEAQKNTIAQTVASMAELGTDATLSTPGMAADAKKTGDEISDLSRQLNDVEENQIPELKNVLGIESNFTTTTIANGNTVVADNIIFNAGDTLKWSIPSAISSTIYWYVYDANDDRLTSGAISAGDTSATRIMSTGVNGGKTSVITSVETSITFEIIPAQTPPNRLDEIDSTIETMQEDIDEISLADIVYGYDLKSANGVETGAGAYYWSGGRPYFNTSGSYGTDYTWYIFPVNKNSVYSVSVAPRWLILVDENGNRVSEDVTGKMINTGNATKLYYTIPNAYVNQFAISEGYLANRVVKKAPKIDMQTEDHHGNAMAIDTLYFTVGMPETLYYNNILALPSDSLECITSCNGQDSHDANGITITPTAEFSNPNNAVRMLQYDNDLNLIYQPYYTGLIIKSLALRDCSVLVIGDSTVGSWGLMTERMLNVFDQNGKTLTLLGTQHSGGTDSRNMHEGRGGWSAKAYCTEETHGSYTNPFLNNGHFDFSYYMNQQGYSAPDFVIIQLGINDVSNVGMPEFDTVATQALGYEKEMIDSIRAYNANIKILINPPTTPTTDQSKLSMYYETTIFRNLVIRYAMMLRRLATQYNASNVRCSNNNLILNSATDIRDSVHPTDAGFSKLGDEMVNQINCW